MNGIKAFVMFFTTISVTFYIFTFLTVMMLFWLLEKRITVKPMLGYSLAVMAVFYVMMFAGRGFNITFLWNLSFYLSVLVMYVFFLSVLLKIINFAVHLEPQTNIIIITVTIAAVFIYGFVNASSLTTKRIEISSDKITRPYKFVQISDVHLGTDEQKEDAPHHNWYHRRIYLYTFLRRRIYRLLYLKGHSYLKL